MSIRPGSTCSLWSTSSKSRDVLNQERCEIVKADMSQKMTEERLIELLKRWMGYYRCSTNDSPCDSKLADHIDLTAAVS